MVSRMENSPRSGSNSSHKSFFRVTSKKAQPTRHASKNAQSTRHTSGPYKGQPILRYGPQKNANSNTEHNIRGLVQWPDTERTRGFRRFRANTKEARQTLKNAKKRAYALQEGNREIAREQLAMYHALAKKLNKDKKFLTKKEQEVVDKYVEHMSVSRSLNEELILDELRKVAHKGKREKLRQQQFNDLAKYALTLHKPELRRSGDMDEM